MDKMLDRFKTDIKKYTDDKVGVKVNYRMSGLFTKLDSDEEMGAAAEGEVGGEQQHIWVTKMEEFRTALNSIHTELTRMGITRPERVKVSLTCYDLLHMKTVLSVRVYIVHYLFCVPLTSVLS